MLDVSFGPETPKSCIPVLATANIGPVWTSVKASNRGYFAPLTLSAPWFALISFGAWMCRNSTRLGNWVPSGANILNRQKPPVRMSISCVSMRNPSGPNHCTICAGSTYRNGLAVSSDRAESSVDVIGNTRTGKRHCMWWSPTGAHRVAVTKTAVPNNRPSSRKSPPTTHSYPRPSVD